MNRPFSAHASAAAAAADAVEEAIAVIAGDGCLSDQAAGELLDAVWPPWLVAFEGLVSGRPRTLADLAEKARLVAHAASVAPDRHLEAASIFYDLVGALADDCQRLANAMAGGSAQVPVSTSQMRPGACRQPQPAASAALPRSPDAALLDSEAELLRLIALEERLQYDERPSAIADAIAAVDTTLAMRAPTTLDGCRAKLRALVHPDFGIQSSRGDNGEVVAVTQVLEFLDGLAAAGFGCVH